MVVAQNKVGVWEREVLMVLSHIKGTETREFVGIKERKSMLIDKGYNYTYTSRHILYT